MDRDRYRDRRSPDRSRYPPSSDTYVPSASRGNRPRSRSPLTHRPRSRSPQRSSNESWRGRDRSPLRRGEPRADAYSRDSRARSPRKDYPPVDSRYDEGSRGARERSPPPKRALSPNGRGDRSPPPAKRERVGSPGREYNRPRSPSHRTYSPRDGRASYRQRSRSPYREGSGRDSHNASRRSSPPHRSYKAEGAEADEGRDPRPLSRVRDDANGSVPPPSDVRERPPPAGPSSSRYGQSSPPAGPSGAPVSMPVHSRPDSFSAPRGGYGGYRGRGGPPRDYSRDYPPPGPGRYPSYGTSSTYHGRGGPPSRDPYPPRDYHDSRGPPPSRYRQDYPPGFRGSSNTTSTTYPRTQRFNQHLADLSQPKQGGEKLPSLYDSTKAEKLEEEAARLRKMIDEKETVKRKGLREWDRLQREADIASLRTDLAEDGVRILNGEAEEKGAAF